MSDDGRIARALLDPASVFADPDEVVRAEDIPDSQKIEILRRWEYDVREQEVAEEENMPGGPRIGLRRVLRALHALGAGPDLAHGPPTKQGGV